MTMALSSGTCLGRYEILSQLGAGGMGEVYLARDAQLGRAVALKILPADVARDQQRMHRFLQEARAASALSHPNIAHIYEIGEANGTRFIAMEYVEGGTLREKIHHEKTSLGKLLRYLAQVADGLAKAHAAGVVHRDLKPDNVMITHDGYAKILDFGLAKLVEPQRTPGSSAQSEIATALMQHSTPGMVMGTVGYMSPEQAQGRVDEIDQRSDIFSFGCILFEAATGRKAFEGKDVLDSLHKIVHAPTPQIKALNADAPDELQRIVRRCLQKDPEKRYQSIKDVALELEELQQELKAEAEPEYSVQPVSSAGAAMSDAQAGAKSALQSPVSTTQVEGAGSATSAEYIVGKIRRHKKGLALVAAVLAVAVAGIAYGLYKFAGHKTASHLQSMKINRLTSSGKVGSASISPDGKYVAYAAADEAGQWSLWVRHVATSGNVQIVPPTGGDVEFNNPVFTPDSNYIYYIRREGSRPGVLYNVPVLGGTSKKLLEDVNVPVSFSPDGRRLAFRRRYASQGEDALMLANADGSGEQRLATRKLPDFFIGAPAWSPDGKIIACSFGSFTDGYYRSIALFQVADGTQKLLTSHRWGGGGFDKVTWLPDASGVVVTAQEQTAAPNQIWYISYPEGEARPLTNDLNSYFQVSITADSNTLAAVLLDLTSNITVTPNGDWNNARQLTTGKLNGGGEGRAVWTPDGRIVYSSSSGGSPDIWIMDADGRNQKQITDDDQYERGFSVTPDGRHIVFDSNRSGAPQIWRVDIDGGNLKQLTGGVGGFRASLSPDGKWVVYTSFGSNAFNIWKVSIDGGEPIQVTTGDSRLPAVSPDGKLVACYYSDKQTRAEKLSLVPFDGGEPVKMFDLPQTSAPRTEAPRWTPDGRSLTYIVTRGPIFSNLWAQPIDGGAPRQLTDFKQGRIFSFDWSRDGKWLLCSRGTVDRDVVLIKDFK